MFKKFLSIALLISMVYIHFTSGLEVSSGDTIEQNESSADINLKAQEQGVEKNSTVATVKPTTKITYGFGVTFKASKLFDGLSKEALADFNDFGKELGKDLLALPEFQAFFAKYDTLYAEYTLSQGDDPKFSIDFVMQGEEAIQAIVNKINEMTIKFSKTISKVDKVALKQDLNILLKMAYHFTLFKISTRKFAAELANLENNEQLQIIVHLD